MRASRLHGQRDLRHDHIEEPTPGPGEVKLRVAHNGICGTDLHFYFELGQVTPEPVVLGHEFSGVVAEVGDDVSRVQVGDRVCVRPNGSCGHCPSCRAGLTHLCRNMVAIGLMAPGGGLAEYSVVPSELVFALPDEISLPDGALVEPMSVSFSGIRRSGIEPGGQVVVLGGGPIGIGVLLGLHAIGVEDVMVVEPSPRRRAAVAELGATEVVDAVDDDVQRAVARWTAERGADAVFECAGVSQSFATALRIVGPRRRVVSIAMYERPVTFNPTELLTNETEIVAAMGHPPGNFESVIDLMAQGRYQTSDWVERIPWDAIVDEGFEPMRRGEKLKVLVDVAP